MTKFTSLRPVLWTERLDETIGFYTQFLGFILQEKNDDWQWASLEKDGVQIMLSKPNEIENFNGIGFTGSFYFNVNNVDELWEDLKTKAKICYEIETFDWEMREFAIYDNNGYILQFGQHINEISKAE
ncbi:Glyoxalase/Bleomycin resistance protein/Dioxygenase superfamily protein [Chryseobacterium wanjuense]|uniref:Glyoxalase/Bleomycin resistance protein/Dioxygenase superfamily protein n=1 Tax=Chryseobacterium wanjuense TaxID=356305 RepID=A0A1I0NZN1_9FLAO|nr:VOC family protein [Chryseobacterium wanjuense]SEW07082.1 Glyoxalase/Bleomycin resistance protein/Dioxygenase superfamily protein [Chryseobacterium wanjuense]